MSSVIPANKLQSRLQHIAHETQSPGSGTKHSASGVITEVYDAERLALTQLPLSVKHRAESSPGLVFAKIRLLNGKDYILPFAEPEDQLFSTYGNHMLLEGRNAKVEYGGVNIETGYIVLQRTYRESVVNLREAGRVLDIGNII